MKKLSVILAVMMSLMVVASSAKAEDCWTLQGDSEVKDLIPVVMCFDKMRLQRAGSDRRESFFIEGEEFSGSLAITRKDDLGDKVVYVAEGPFMSVDHGTCSTNLQSKASLKFSIDKATGHIHFAVQGLLVDYVYNSDPCHLMDQEGSLVYLHRRMD